MSPQITLALALAISVATSGGVVYIQHLRHELQSRNTRIDSLEKQARSTQLLLVRQAEYTAKAERELKESRQHTAALKIQTRKDLEGDACAQTDAPSPFLERLRGH